MPFRLLGLVVDPSQAGRLCGHTLSHYAASGNQVTLLCAAGRGWPTPDAVASARGLGIDQVIALDLEMGEVNGEALESIVCDVIAALRPHVVLTESSAAVRQAAAAAFSRTRQRGSGALPAKLYYRVPALTTEVTTMIHPGEGDGPEYFVRAHPSPWVTGVLERDLLAGIVPGGERLAA